MHEERTLLPASDTAESLSAVLQAECPDKATEVSASGPGLWRKPGLVDGYIVFRSRHAGATVSVNRIDIIAHADGGEDVHLVLVRPLGSIDDGVAMNLVSKLQIPSTPLTPNTRLSAELTKAGLDTRVHQR